MRMQPSRAEQTGVRCAHGEHSTGVRVVVWGGRVSHACEAVSVSRCVHGSAQKSVPPADSPAQTHVPTSVLVPLSPRADPCTSPPLSWWSLLQAQQRCRLHQKAFQDVSRHTHFPTAGMSSSITSSGLAPSPHHLLHPDAQHQDEAHRRGRRTALELAGPEYEPSHAVWRPPSLWCHLSVCNTGG